MKIREIKAKSILSTSRVYDYSLNPYVGCQHGCVYCYAKFMKRFTGHKEKWGEFRAGREKLDRDISGEAALN